MKNISLILALVVMITACSRKSDIEMYKEAQAFEGQKNFYLAIEKYNEIVNKFEKSVYAESSQYRIALLYNNELRDYSKAASAYMKYYSIFPDSKNGPVALFMAGFIMNNELHKLDSAKIFFDMFLQKYPQNELATSAKFELETLGKDPTELLKSEVTQNPDHQNNKTKKNQ